MGSSKVVAEGEESGSPTPMAEGEATAHGSKGGKKTREPREPKEKKEKKERKEREPR